MVYVPPGYDQGDARMPVLYLQDGQNLFDAETAFWGQEWRADEAADGLIEAGVIEPAILVGVYNTGVRRISEYTPTRDPQRRKGGKGDRYSHMLARELKPFIDAEYRTSRSGHGVGGSSLGGLVALEAALLYPRVFTRAAVISPSVWWYRRSILELIRQHERGGRARIWLDSGTCEGESVVEDLRMLRDALVEKGWREGETLRYAEVEGAGHNEQAWAARFGAVLEWLFPRVSSRPG